MTPFRGGGVTRISVRPARRASPGAVHLAPTATQAKIEPADGRVVGSASGDATTAMSLAGISHPSPRLTRLVPGPEMVGDRGRDHGEMHWQ